jgi:hypothetical protein
MNDQKIDNQIILASLLTSITCAQFLQMSYKTCSTANRGPLILWHDGFSVGVQRNEGKKKEAGDDEELHFGQLKMELLQDAIFALSSKWKLIVRFDNLPWKLSNRANYFNFTNNAK